MRADRWQTGDCGAYALALLTERPGLRLGAVQSELSRDNRALHFFAHDDTHAYDSRGRHELPYTQVWDSAARDYFPADAAGELGHWCVLDQDVEAYGGWSDREYGLLPLARRHIRRHNVLPGLDSSQARA